MTQPQFNFEQSRWDGADGIVGADDIITPTGTAHTLFIGLDGYLRCKDSSGIVEHVLTETGGRINCSVYPRT